MSAGDVAAAILSSLKFIHTNFVASPRLEDEAAKAIAQRLCCMAEPIERWKASITRGKELTEGQQHHIDDIGEKLEAITAWLTDFHDCKKRGGLARGLRMCKNALQAGIGCDTSFDRLNALVAQMECAVGKLQGMEVLSVSVSVREVIRDQKELMDRVNKMLEIETADGCISAESIEEIARHYGMGLEEVKHEIAGGNKELWGLIRSRIDAHHSETVERQDSNHRDNIEHQDVNHAEAMGMLDGMRRLLDSTSKMAADERMCAAQEDICEVRRMLDSTGRRMADASARADIARLLCELQSVKGMMRSLELRVGNAPYDDHARLDAEIECTTTEQTMTSSVPSGKKNGLDVDGSVGGQIEMCGVCGGDVLVGVHGIKAAPRDARVVAKGTSVRGTHVDVVDGAALGVLLIDAARRGVVGDVRRILTVNGWVQPEKKQSVCRRTALHHASSRGHIECVVLLSQAGGQKLVMSRHLGRATAFHSAASNGHVDCVEYLASIGGESLLMSTGVGGRTALHSAAEEGHVDCVKFLADRGGRELIMARGVGGRTALHSAAEEGHVDCVKFLADRGGRELIMATVQRGEFAGKTAIEVASYNGHAHCETQIRAFLGV